MADAAASYRAEFEVRMGREHDGALQSVGNGFGPCGDPTDRFLKDQGHVSAFLFKHFF